MNPHADGDGVVTGQGPRRPAAPEPRRTVPGLVNGRDLGGIPAGPGARVRFGRVYRSAGLHGLTGSGAAALGALGLRTVLDLRDEYELINAPDDPGFGVATLNIPVLGGRPVPAAQRALYLHMIENCGAAFTRAVRALADAAGHPVLVHCAVGKDRTGVVVALALAAVGVPDGEIIKDFELSNAGLGITLPPPDVDVDQYQTGRPVRGALIAQALGRARELGGDIPGFLTGHGMTPEELDTLRTALVEPVPDPGEQP